MNPRRLFLDADAQGGAPRLAPGEAHHGLHVLRLVPGDEVLGLDGAGRAWPLRVTRLERGDLQLERTGEARTAAPLTPAIEVAVSLPRRGRAEEMVDRLTQLGLGALRPTVFEHTQGFGRELGAGRRERLQRAAREACKQSGRLWLPRVLAPHGLAQVLAEGGPAALLDPAGDLALVDWLAGVSGSPALRLIVGPEGGTTAEERRAAVEAGVALVSLAGPVLRTETAAELGCGLAMQLGC